MYIICLMNILNMLYIFLTYEFNVSSDIETFMIEKKV